MTTVVARPAAGKSVDSDDFTDLTDVLVDSIDWAAAGMLRVVFAGDLPADVAAAVRRRIVSATPVEEELRGALEGFLDDPAGHNPAAVLVDVVRLALCLGTGENPS